MTLEVQVVSPERILWSGEAERVRCRTVGGGDIAFMTDHAPFVGALDIGVAKINPVDGDDELVAVHGGFVEVSDNRVSLLSDVAELASQVDVDRARRAKEAAESRAREADDDHAAVAVRRAEVRLEAAGHTP